MSLLQSVRIAVISLLAPLRPTPCGCRAEAEAAGGLLKLPFTQRAAFNQQMNEQLDDSSRVLDDLDAKLRKLRTHVVNLRNQLITSQSATEATWDQVKAGFGKEHTELHEGVCRARAWAMVKPQPDHR